MKKSVKLSVAIAALLLAGASQAGTSSGPVTTLIVNAANFLFFTAGTKTGSPSCGNNNQWAINLGTAQGKSIYVMLLAAQAQNKDVTVYGNNTCNFWGDREDVLYAVTQ